MSVSVSFKRALEYALSIRGIALQGIDFVNGYYVIQTSVGNLMYYPKWTIWNFLKHYNLFINKQN